MDYHDKMSLSESQSIRAKIKVETKLETKICSIARVWPNEWIGQKQSQYELLVKDNFTLSFYFFVSFSLLRKKNFAFYCVKTQKRRDMDGSMDDDNDDENYVFQVKCLTFNLNCVVRLHSVQEERLNHKTGLPVLGSAVTLTFHFPFSSSFASFFPLFSNPWKSTVFFFFSSLKKNLFSFFIALFFHPFFSSFKT